MSVLVQVDLLAERACSGVPSTGPRSVHRHTLVLLAEVGGRHRVSAFLLLQSGRAGAAMRVPIIIARARCGELLPQRQALKDTRSARGLQDHALLGASHSLGRLGAAPLMGSQLAACAHLSLKAASLTRARRFLVLELLLFFRDTVEARFSAGSTAER